MRNEHFHNFIWDLYDLKRRVKVIFPSSLNLSDKSANYNPVFIVSCGRSGNTLLRRILNSSDEIYFPSEIETLGHVISIFIRYKNLPWNELINLILSSIEYYPEFSTLRLDSLRELAHKLYKVDIDKRNLAFILNEFYMFILKSSDIECNRWGDKTPMNSKYIFRIIKIFPNAKFIHMVRNGYDVISSYSQNKLLNIEEAALRWKNANEYLLKFGAKYKNNYMMIKYEDLVNFSEETVNEVCEFINIEYSDELFEFNRLNRPLGDIELYDHHKNVYNPIDSSRIGIGKNNFDQNQIRMLKSIIAEKMSHFNYEI